MTNYYTLLQISSGATSAQIKKAYKQMALKYHPDRNEENVQAEEMFKKINEAYQTLSDPTQKARYDASLQFEEAKKQQFYKQYTSTGYEHYQDQKQQSERQSNWSYQETYQKQQQYYRRKTSTNQRSKKLFVFGRMELYTLLIMAGIFVVSTLLFNWLNQVNFDKSIASAKIAIQEGKWANASYILNQANEYKEEEPIYYFLMGKIAEQTNWTEAISFYTLAIDAEEEEKIRREYFKARAKAYVENDESKRAIEEYKRIYFQDKTDVYSLAQIAFVYLDQLKNYEQANLYFDKYIALADKGSPSLKKVYEGKLQAKKALQDEDAVAEIERILSEF